jgi:hypothetical protein
MHGHRARIRKQGNGLTASSPSPETLEAGELRSLGVERLDGLQVAM